MDSTAPEIWKKEILRLHRRIAKMESQHNLHVFYGSSSVRLWVNMVKDLAPLNVLNLGFGGSSFEWCLYYFDELFEQVEPSHLILYAGENDISHGTPSNRVLFNFERLFEKALREYPQADITVISLKPSLKRTDLIPKIQDVNRLISRFIHNHPKGKFVDVFSHMLDGQGNPRGDLFLSDGLHMNKEGYKIWTAAMRSYFKLPQRNHST